MTVYLPKGCITFYYNFSYRGHRYTASTGQLRKDDAREVEYHKRLAVRRRAAGLQSFDVAETPLFSAWAGVYEAYQARFTSRPDLVSRALSVVLEFWGAPPKRPKVRPKGTNAHPVPAPSHDLRLGDPIADPSWIERFEQWIAARRVSGSTRNTYLSVLSGLYRVALAPEHRQASGVTSNPFRDIRRSPPQGRVIALSVDQVKAWMTGAPPHVRVAMAIAALAPKLRLQTILKLEWAVHLDQSLTRIVVGQHKTAGRTGRPQVTPIPAQLTEILKAVQKASPGRYVVTYRGAPVSSITKATKRAALDAGLTWGVSDGVTFHTLRHSIATLLAELGIGERLRMELMGHKEIRTTQQYTHLVAAAQVQPHEQLSAAMAIRDVVLPCDQAPVKSPKKR